MLIKVKSKWKVLSFVGDCYFEGDHDKQMGTKRDIDVHSKFG